jgi:hypothetical protein
MEDISAQKSIKDTAFCDIERELAATRRVLERVPEEQFVWKPHEKSMSLQQLAGHVATMPIWCVLTRAGWAQLYFAAAYSAGF